MLLLILTLWHCVTCSVTSSLRLSRYCSLYFLRKINHIRPWSTQISDGDLMEISCNRVTHNSFGIRSCDCKFTFVICSKIYICHIFQNSPLSYLLNSYLSYLLNSHLSYFPKFIFVMFAKIHICHVSYLPDIRKVDGINNTIKHLKGCSKLWFRGWVVRVGDWQKKLVKH